MTDPNDTKPDYLGRATDEVKAMGKEGFAHPSTKAVAGGAALGAVAAILPVITLPIGIIGGAAIALWLRIKR